MRAAFEASRIRVSVVKHTDCEVRGFIVLPKRWIVERTLDLADKGVGSPSRWSEAADRQTRSDAASP